MIGILLALAGIAFAADTARQRVDHYDVILRLPPDGLFAQEEMEIEVRIEDTARPDPLTGFAAVARAIVLASIDMPDMPGMPKYSETAHAEGVPGEYGIHPTFAHGGEYRLRLAVTPPADSPFNIEFRLPVYDGGKSRARQSRPPRFTMEIGAHPKRPEAGKPVDLRLVIRDRDNPKAIHSSFETVHEAPLHLIVVSADLSYFAHEHPELATDGSFHLRFAFPGGGSYRLFADVAPRGAGSQVLMGSLNVSGVPTKSAALAPTTVVMERQTPPEAFPAARTVDVFFTIRDSHTGDPMRNLQPYLGAMGHLMLVHEDAATFVHSHPDESAEGVAEGRLKFLARFPKPGLYHGWLQVQRDGRVETAAFLFRAVAAND